MLAKEEEEKSVEVKIQPVIRNESQEVSKKIDLMESPKDDQDEEEKKEELEDQEQKMSPV